MRKLLLPAFGLLFFFNAVQAAPLEREMAGNPSASRATVLTLDQCIEIAMRSNPGILQASTGFLDAEGKAVRLRSFIYPQAQAQAISTPPTIYVQVEQVIYSREISPRLKLARLTAVEATLNYRQVLTTSLFRLRQAFALNLARQQQIRLLESRFVFDERFVKRANELFEAGRTQKAEIQRLEVKANLTKQRLLEARSARHQALLAMEEILGEKLDEAVTFQGKLGEETIPELNLQKLKAEAFSNRADLQALNSKEIANRQLVVLSTQDMYPRLGFSAKPVIEPGFLDVAKDYDPGRNDNERSTQRAAGNTQVPLSLFLTWTFFDGGGSSGSKQSAEATLVSGTIARDSLLKAIPGEIQSSIDKLTSAQETLEVLVVSADSKQQRDLAEESFLSGKIRVFDQSLLEDELLGRDEKILEARLNFSLSAAALDRSLGRYVLFKNPQ